ncbi:MAG: hypothetical protein BIFFINMI_01336 [Phycisphaerae bacterium]|nr:hypothetical protein [Phycisphaerae bacterium]
MAVSTTNGRVGTMRMSELTLASIQRTQVAMAKVQAQLASGNRYQLPSESPIASGRILDLTSLLSRLGQYQKNVDFANGFLSTADTALGEATDLVRQANTLALQSADATVSDAERSSNAELLDSIIDQLLRVANRTYQGRYLFDGSAGAGDPFADASGAIQYNGGSDPVNMALGENWLVRLQLDGGSVFGGASGDVTTGKDLDPILTDDTLVADLNGAAGRGVSLAAIRVSDGVNPAVDIDLSGAATVGDVIDRFNDAAPAGMTMAINAAGNGLTLTSSQSGADITVIEQGSGSAARDLGIYSKTGAGATLAGGDVDPQVTGRTAWDSLNAGTGLDRASGLVITNGTDSAAIDLSSAETVQDILNAINQAGVGVRASIRVNGGGISLVNLRAGSVLNVAENGGTTADDLGLRTFHQNVLLADLNGGSGVHTVGGFDDLRITQRDGTTIDVNLDSARTIGDVIDLINGDDENGGDLLARVGADGGLELVDSSTDGGFDLSVSALNLSAAPGELGLVQSVANPGATLTGDDVSGVRTDGIFSHLVGLRDALRSGDLGAISLYADRLQSDVDNLVEIRGRTGAVASQAQQQVDHLDTQTLDTQTLLSQVRDMDFTEAVILFQQLQTQYQAGLAAAARVLNLSLLDYL